MRRSSLAFTVTRYAMVVFFVCVIPVNLAFDANYFWLCGKPSRPTLLDHLGPWPWYLFVVALVGLAHFAIAYLPIHFVNRLEQRRC